MSKITQELIEKVAKAKEIKLKQGINALTKIWYGPHARRLTTKEEIKDVLQSKFPGASIIKVKDVSGGSGAIYEVLVEDKKFKNMPILKQHQAVTDALKDQIKLMHGIRIITKIPT